MENNKTTIDDVIKFIDEQGDIYGARIREELDKKKNDSNEKIKNILNKRHSMYERLAKL
jgi:hypothetical protein